MFGLKIMLMTALMVNLAIGAAYARELTKAEQAVIAQSVQEVLKDPESARFKWRPIADSDKLSVTYCAFVNAKNSDGNYVGDMPFSSIVMMENGKVVGAIFPNVAGGDQAPSALRDNSTLFDQLGVQPGVEYDSSPEKLIEICKSMGAPLY